MEDGANSVPSSHHSLERDVSDTVCEEPELEKKLAIEDACARCDISSLKALAESAGGFLTDDIRRRACTCIWSCCLQRVCYLHR